MSTLIEPSSPRVDDHVVCMTSYYLILGAQRNIIMMHFVFIQ